jgi:hypothetical protein
VARISVVPIPPLDNISWSYDVEITESNYYMDLTDRGRRINPEEFIKKSSEFLLAIIIFRKKSIIIFHYSFKERRLHFIIRFLHDLHLAFKVLVTAETSKHLVDICLLI